MSQNTSIRVALLLGQDLGYCRRVLSGILDYAEEKKLPWVYHDAPPEIRILPALRQWKPDGVIAHLFNRELADKLLQMRTPVVSTTHTLAHFSGSVVDVDNVEIGREAARYFLHRDYRSFGYYGSRHTMFSIARKSGFQKELRSHGFELSECHADFLPRSPFSQNWMKTEKRAAAWLRSLPKPVAILSSNDIPARALGEVCRAEGFQVPQEVALLGVDNDDSECRLANPTLSSVDTPSFQIGRRAAELLDKQMRGKDKTHVHEFLSPRAIIVRESTDFRATSEPRLKKALTYVEERAHEGLSVADVCFHIGISRRTLERLFRDNLHSSIHLQIQRVQVEHAKRLLDQTELSISQIAERSGLGSLRRLDRVFRIHVGSSPTQYRNEAAC